MADKLIQRHLLHGSQEFELLDHLSVKENILLPYFVHPALSLDREVDLAGPSLILLEADLSPDNAKWWRLIEPTRDGVSMASRGVRPRAAWRDIDVATGAAPPSGIRRTSEDLGLGESARTHVG